MAIPAEDLEFVAQFAPQTAQESVTPQQAANLLAFAQNNNLRVTSGFSRGGHNTNSLHYQGSETDPMAIDVDHRNWTPELAQAAAAAGFVIRDERQRPKGQAVWTGPHIHLERRRGSASAIPEEDRAFVAQFAPKATGGSSIGQLVDRTVQTLRKPHPQRVPDTNFFGDVAEGFKFGASAGRIDEPRGQGVGTAIGETLGPLLPTVAGGLAGGLLGPAGAVAGGATAGGLTFAGIEEARQRKAGQAPDLGKIALEGGVGAVSSAIPIFRSGRLFSQILKNAAASGAVEGAGSVARQSMDGSVDAGRVLQDAGAGAVFGGALGAVFPKIRQVHPEIAAKIEAEQPLSQPEAEAVQQLLTPEESEALSQAFRERGGFTGQERRGNLDAQVLGPDGQPIQIAPDRLRTPYEIALERTRETPQAPPQVIPQIEIARGLQARPDAQPLSNINPVTGLEYDAGLGPKRAAASAEILSRTSEEQALAQQTFDDAVARYNESEAAVKQAAGVDDLAEAQRIIGQEINAGGDRAVLDSLLSARRDLEAARAILDDVNRPVSRSTLPEPTRPVEPPRQPLGRAPVQPEPQRPVTQAEGLTQPKGLSRPAKPSPDTGGLILKGSESLGLSRGGLVDASGRPLNAAPVDVGLVDAQGAPARSADAPSQKPNGNTIKTDSGAEVFMHGRDEAQTRSIVEKIEQLRSDGTREQLISEQEAANLIDQKVKAGLLSAEEAQKQKDILSLALESGRNGREFIVSRREIQEGMGALSEGLGKQQVKQRDGLAVFAVSTKQIKPSTYANNLAKQLGSPHAAVEQLRQTAGKYGITPTTKGKTPAANARYIAEQISKHPQGRLELSDVYLNLHNFKTGGERTAADAPRGYPLRTIESANIGVNEAVIPSGAVYQNKVAQARQSLSQLAQDAGIAADVRQSLERVVSGSMTKADRAKVRKLLESSPEQLQKFCKILGI